MESKKKQIAKQLVGIERYNPDNIEPLVSYVDFQAREPAAYDVEANLALLKLLQFNGISKPDTLRKILLKALTALPASDFTLCKCLIDEATQHHPVVARILKLHDDLETCNFIGFWLSLRDCAELVADIVGFEDSIRRFICRVISITYQTIDKVTLSELLNTPVDTAQGVANLGYWIDRYRWTDSDRHVLVCNHDDSIKTKNIVEKITFESVMGLMKL